MIKIESLTTGYKTKSKNIEITKDISAVLFPGALTCLIGPNGAGKSTLLKTLSAFLTPLKGSIFFDGVPLNHLREEDLSKIISVVLTDRFSFSNMTAKELIALGRSPYTGFFGKLRQKDNEEVEEAINLIGIENLKDRAVNTLSDGERQKVLIAKAIAQSTPVIFLDEPTAFLDYPGKVEIMQLLQKLSRKKNKIIFLSTHDLDIALQIADQIWLIDRVHGVKTGTPEDLSLEDALRLYLQRGGVEFDRETGLFKISHKINYYVNLLGEGVYFNMAKKAFARNSIGISPFDTDITVYASDKGFEVSGIKVGSIAQLLKIINQRIDKKF